MYTAMYMIMYKAMYINKKAPRNDRGDLLHKGIRDFLHGFEIRALVYAFGCFIFGMAHERRFIGIRAVGIFEKIGEKVPAGIGDICRGLFLGRDLLNFQMSQERIEYFFS